MLGVLANPQAGLSDVTLSTSTDPSGRIDARISDMLGREAEALRRMPASRISALANPSETPRARPQGLRALFGRRAAEPETPPMSRAGIDALPEASGGAEWACLAEALYFEARGETVKGQFAVAEVILNRVASTAFPDTICSVVNQGTGQRYRCQFTYTCDGHAEVVHEKAAYRRVGKVARLAMDGDLPALTSGATYYHTNAVSPRWSRKFERTATIGVHHFYRDPRQVAQR